jgi:hypothetical protein
MYGMVNLAIQGFLTERYGQAVWETVKQQVAPDLDHFLTMEQYPEEVTQGLVAAAAEITEKPMHELLDDIGEYFTGYAKRSGHGELLDIIGGSLPEALNNLDNMHTRVALAFPDLRPPSFWCTDVDEGSLILHYLSERTGLAPMIPGAVRGLAGMFGTDVVVRQVVSREDGADHDQFLVTLDPGSQR